MEKLETRYPTDILSDRDEFGRFRPGNKVLGGRPPGSRNKSALWLDEIAWDDAEAIIRGVVRDAKEGNAQARRIVADRIWAKRRGRPLEFDLPHAQSIADIPKAMAALLSAVARGDLTIEEGNTVAATMSVQLRALQLSEFEQLVAELRQIQEERRKERDAP